MKLGEILASVLAEESANLSNHRKGAKTESNPFSILDLVKEMDSEIESYIENEKKESQALSVELKMLIESGHLQTYNFLELYEVLENTSLVATPVNATVIRISMEEGQLVDNHGNILPAYRELLTDEFILLKDYEFLKSSQAKKETVAMVSTQEALEALGKGKSIRVEYTTKGGQLATMILEPNAAVHIPMEALTGGVFYIVK